MVAAGDIVVKNKRAMLIAAWLSSCFLKNVLGHGAREMVQHLRAFVALAEDLSTISSMCHD